MGTVITGDSDDFGWNVKPQQSSGRQGLTGKQLCQSAFSAVFDASGAEKVDAKTPLIVLATSPQPDALENLQVPSILDPFWAEQLHGILVVGSSNGGLPWGRGSAC